MDTPGLSHDELAAVFRYPGVAAAYQYRPAYPPEVFDVLETLLADRCPVVLDIGAGEGALARPMAGRVERVDAVELSEAMIDAGRQRPGGQRRNLRWILGRAETARLDGPYGLVTAGASLHWMVWDQVLPRLAAVMTPGAVLAIVDHRGPQPPWHEDLRDIIVRHSRSRDFDPDFSLVNALSQRGLFRVIDEMLTAPTPIRQPVAAYIEQFHSTASLARELMSGEEARTFDRCVEELVEPWAVDGLLELEVMASVTWGRPG